MKLSTAIHLLAPPVLFAMHAAATSGSLRADSGHAMGKTPDSSTNSGRRYLSDDYEYEYFGNGECRDSAGTIYSFVRWDNVWADECVSNCEVWASSTIPLIGYNLKYDWDDHTIEGEHSQCKCYYDSTDTLPDVTGHSVKSYGLGVGAIEDEAGSSAWECYRIVGYLAPTNAPTTQAPSSAPSVSPAPSMAPSPSPTLSPFRSQSELQAAVDEWMEDGTRREAIEYLHGPIGQWDVSGVTLMKDIFSKVRNSKTQWFNEDISGWNVESVVRFDNMFLKSAAFNQDISGWKTGSATSFFKMFKGAEVFDQDLSSWDVSSSTNFKKMFYDASAFNQDISGWANQVDISSTNGDRMFLDSGCEVMADPGEELVEGTDGYFCRSADGESVLTKDDFFEQAALAAELAQTSYFGGSASAGETSFDSDKFHVFDKGNYNYDTAIVARKDNVVYLAFRGTHIEVDDLGFIEWSSSEISVTEDSTESLFFQYPSACYAHEGLSSTYLAISAEADFDGLTMDEMVAAEISNCKDEYTSSQCQFVITGHSSGAGIATVAAAYYGISSTDLRLFTFGAVASMQESDCDYLFDTANVYNFVTRYLDYHDPVAFMDFDEGYWHFGPMIVLTAGDYNSVDWVDDATDLTSLASLDPNDMEDFIRSMGDCIIFSMDCGSTIQGLLHKVDTYTDWLGSGRTGVSINYGATKSVF